MGRSCNGHNLCVYVTVPQLQHSHGAVVWPDFLSGHVENMHLFKSLQTPEPHFLDDMLLRSEGMMGNWKFPRNIVQFRHIWPEWPTCLCVAPSAKQQTVWYLFMCKNKPPYCKTSSVFSCAFVTKITSTSYFQSNQHRYRAWNKCYN